MMFKKKMKYTKRFLFITTVCLILTACAETKILERISLVTLIGYDKEEEKLSTTAVVRQISPDFENKVEIHSEIAETSKGARFKINLDAAKKVEAGQVRVVLFGDDLAKEGIEEEIHTLSINPEIATSVYLGIVEGKSKTLLESNFKNITDIGQHVYNLIDHNIQQQQMISSTLHEIERDVHSPIRDFAIPTLKKEGEYIDINGIALFKEGKLVGKLPTADVFYIMLLRKNIRDGTLQLVLPGDLVNSSKNPPENTPEELPIAVDAINSKRKLKVTDHEKNEIDLNITLDCRLLEIHSSLSLEDKETTEKIEKAMNKKMEAEIKRIIKYSQEVNSDIFGFGEHFSAHVRGSKLNTEEKWHNLYPKMKVNVKVDTEIIRNGVFE